MPHAGRVGHELRGVWSTPEEVEQVGQTHGAALCGAARQRMTAPFESITSISTNTLPVCSPGR